MSGAPDTPSSPVAASSASARRLGVLAPLLLVAVVLAFFGDVLLGDLQFYARDAGRMCMPGRLFLFSELRAGRFPLWFPFEAGGVPFHAQLVQGVLHPLNLLYAVLPFARAFQLNYVGAYALAALATYLLARGRGISRLGAFTAGVAYALCGHLASQPNLQYLVGNASFPLALFAFDRFRAKPGVGSALLSSAGSALLLLAGEPQALVVFGLFVLVELAFERTEARRTLALLALTLAGAALLSAAQLIPAIEAFLQSRRLTVGVTDHTRWVFPPLRFIDLVVPYWMAGPLETELFEHVGAGSYPWSQYLYVGPAALLLAIAGARTSRRMSALGVAALICIWIGLGPAFGLERLLTAVVPLWKGFRYPEKLLAFTSLGIAVLAGSGLDALSDAATRRTLRFGALGMALVSLGCGAVWISGRGGQFAAPLGRLALLSLTSVGIAAVLSFASRPLVAAGLVTVPLFLFNHGAPKLVPPGDLFTLPWAAQVIAKDAHTEYPTRVYTEDPGGQLMLPEASDQTLAAYVAMRDQLLPDFSAPFGIENFARYMPAEDYRHELGIKGAPAQLYPRLLPIFGVEYLVSARLDTTPPAPWTLFAENRESHVRIFKPAYKLDRAFIARSVATVHSPEEALAALASPKLRPGDTAVVECAALPGDEAVQPRGEARVSSWSPEEVVVDAELKAPGFLVLNDSAAPGWHAYDADGSELPVCTANLRARAVRLSEGRHRIQFVYEPASWPLGWTLSLGTLVLWGGVALLLAARRRAQVFA